MSSDQRSAIRCEADTASESRRKVDIRRRSSAGLDCPQPNSLSPSAIKALRQRGAVSQAVFASLLGTSIWTVRQWEQGVRSPTGSALKLLDLVDRKGLDVLL